MTNIEKWEEEWLATLAAGVVFDWSHPVLVGYTQRWKKAGQRGKFYVITRSQGQVLIWEDGNPVPKPSNFKFAGNEVFELTTGFGAHGEGDVWNCFVPKSERPDWDEDTYWPVLEEEI